MPEGPEVRIIADCLEKVLVGKTLLNICFDERSRYARHPLPNLDELTFPYKFSRVFTKGKKIIMMLSKDIYLISSLGMEGKWTFEKGTHSNLWFELSDDEENNILYFNDSRHFGILEILTSENQLKERLSKIGPDLLNEEVSEDLWKKISRGKRIQKMQICKFLMEQKYFSGIGNYLRAEILYQAKIRPDRSLGELSDEELETIRVAALQLIRSSYESKGCTLHSYWDVYGNTGDFKVIVYEKSTDPFGNTVQRDTFSDGRTMHWVPAVQV
jgi:DNA-formamidopyrimidine glycosylase